MKFKLIIDKTGDEEIVATVHERTELTDIIEQLVLKHSGSDRISVYNEDEIKMLGFSEIECITIIDGKTYAIDSNNHRYRLKQRLYEHEKLLPPYYIRINKSSLANESRL